MKLLITDDHKLFIEGIRHLLHDEFRIEIAGIAYNGKEAIDICKKQKFDVALMDINMPVIDGIHATREIKRFQPAIKIIIVSMMGDFSSAVKALKAGKHVFVEKPLAINSAQLSVISAQLKANSQSLLTVGFNRRFASLAQRLKTSIANRQSSLYVHYRVNAGPIPLNHWTQDPEIGGGRIVGEACHFIDFITFLVGDVPSSVTAQPLPDNGKYREDNVSMTFTFRDGSIGIVDYLANGDKSFPKERVEVFCGGQVAVLDDFVSLQITRDGKTKEEKMAQDKGWVNEWKVFVKSIREGGEPPIPYQQLIGVTKSTFAALDSLRKQEIIKLS